MKYFLFISFVFYTIYGKPQIPSGYYEQYDPSGILLDRLLIADSCFEQYIFLNEKTIYGKGIIKIENQIATFQYDELNPVQFYSILYECKKETESEIIISVRIDSTNYQDSFDPCSFYFINNKNDSVLFDNIVTFANDTSIREAAVNISSKLINNNVQLMNDFDQHFITLLLDNNSYVNINKQIIEYRVESVSKKQIVLLDKNDLLIVYKKNKKEAKDFSKYLEMKEIIEIPF